MNASHSAVLATVALVTVAGFAVAHHSSPYSSWAFVQGNLDWTTATHAELSGATPAGIVTNVVCFGNAATNMRGPGEVTNLDLDVVGPVASGTIRVSVPGPRAECPADSGAGVLKFDFTGRFDDHRASGNAVTLFGAYRVSGSGAYAGVNGGGQLSISLTGALDATSGYPTLADGSLVGGTHY